MVGARMGGRWSRTEILEPALQAVLLVLVLAVVFPGVFFEGKICSGSDLLYDLPPWKPYAPPNWEGPQNPLVADVISAFYPSYVNTRAALDRGEWPLWNPNQCGGMPLMANCQSAVFYPPRLLYQFLDIPVAYSVHVLFKLWLCGMTAFLCARGIGLSLGAARFLSLAWMLTSYNQFWALWPLPDVSAWLPVLFLGVELAFSGAVRRAVLAIASGGTLILLAGHPETAFAMSFDLGVYVLLRFVFERRRGAALWRPAAACAFGWAVALLATCVQWLPFIEYLLNSYTLFERHGDRFQSHLLPNTAVCLFVPRFFGAEADRNFWGDLDGNRYAIYPGIVVWMGAALLLVRRRELGADARRWLALAVAAACAFGFTFAVPGFQWLHELPGFASLRENYHIGFGLFALAVLAASGIERWLARPGRPRDLAWTLVVLVPAALMVFGALEFYGGIIRLRGQGPYTHEKMLLTGCVAAAALLLLGARAYLARPRVLMLLLTTLLTGDLIAAGWAVTPTVARSEAFPDTALFAYLRNQGGPVRIEPGGGLPAPGVCSAFGVQEWMGYDGIYPKRVLHLVRTLKQDMWNALEPVCSVRFYLRHPDMERGPIPTPVFEFENPAWFKLRETVDGVMVYENRRVVPRAFLVGGVREVPDITQLFETMRNATYNPLQEVLTDNAPRGPLPSPSPIAPGSAAIEEYRTTRVRLTAEARTRCALVLADSYFPGWNAYVDGVRTEIFPAYYIFRGVLLPEGRHAVEFRYEPWSFRAGLWISVSTLVCGLVYTFTAWRRKSA